MIEAVASTVKCSFCGKSKERAKKLIAGAENVLICDVCAELCAELCKDKVSSEHSIELAIPTPMEIHRSFDEYVIGQEEAKKSLAVAAYNHYKRISFLEQNFDTTIQKSNILLLGASGTGKTYLAQTMAKLLNVPFAIADATSLTEAGYIGDDVETVLQKLIQAADGDVEQAEHGIVFIDEIDKIACASESSNRRDVGGASVQHALLKIIEGTISSVPIKGVHKDSKSECVQIDTTNILFICGGAFDGIEKIIEKRMNNKVIGFSARMDSAEDGAISRQVDTEDLQKYGLIPEMIGRLPVITQLSLLDKNMLVSMLTEPKNAIIEQYRRLLKMDGATLEFTNEALSAIAEQAITRKTGARGLRTIVESFMRDIMYEIPSKRGSIKKIIITKETVTNRTPPKMICMTDGDSNE